MPPNPVAVTLAACSLIEEQARLAIATGTTEGAVL